MPVANLILRIPKGSPLTPGEMDGNLEKLRDFSNGLETRIGVSLDEDGNPTETLLNALRTAAYGTGTFSAGVYSMSLSDPAPTAYTAGMLVAMKALTANTGAVDININSLGVKNILKNSTSELVGGEIPLNGIVLLQYDGTNFQMVGQYSGFSASQLDEAARAGVHQYAVGVQTTGVYAVTLSPAATEYKNGMRVAFKADSVNTGAVDINVNGLGVKNIFKSVNAELVGGEILANGVVELIYDGSAFQLQSTQAFLNLFTSIEYAVADGAIANVAHGLGSKPGWVRWVLVCQTIDIGYAVGDEVDVQAFFLGANGRPIFTTGSNTTNVFITGESTGSCKALNKSTGNSEDVTPARWKSKCYARL